MLYSHPYKESPATDFLSAAGSPGPIACVSVFAQPAPLPYKNEHLFF